MIDFDGQFLLGDAPLPPDPLKGGPHAGTDVSLSAVSLRIYPKSPMLRLQDGDGRVIGAILGYPVDLRSGRLIRDDLTLNVVVQDNMDVDRLVEEHVYSFSGSFLFVLDLPGVRRLYLDACGSRTAVFDPQARLAGATGPLLLGPEAADRMDRELYGALDVVHDGWFPAGLTAHRGVERLLVNHYLDLDRWTQHRHWPSAPIPQADLEAACGRVLEATRRTVKALHASEELAVSLTAGNETRFILAACRGMAPELNFVTADVPDAALDVHQARELARRFGLHHSVLPNRRADAQQAEDWQRRAGFCIGGSNMWNHPTVAPLKGRMLIAGNGGETGRAFFWRPSDTAETEIDVDRLLPRFGMPAHPRIRAAVAVWLSGVEGFDPFLKLDLAYLELRVGCWAFAQSYVMPDLPEVSPMMSRDSVEAMLSLPPAARRTNGLILTGIRIAWPELLDLPINRYGDWRDRFQAGPPGTQ